MNQTFVLFQIFDDSPVNTGLSFVCCFRTFRVHQSNVLPFISHFHCRYNVIYTNHSSSAIKFIKETLHYQMLIHYSGYCQLLEFLFTLFGLLSPTYFVVFSSLLPVFWAVFPWDLLMGEGGIFIVVVKGTLFFDKLPYLFFWSYSCWVKAFY